MSSKDSKLISTDDDDDDDDDVVISLTGDVCHSGVLPSLGGPDGWSSENHEK